MHDNENHSTLGWKVLIKFVAGSLAIFLVIYLSDPYQIHLEGVIQPKRIIEMAIEDITNTMIINSNEDALDNKSLRQVALTAFEIVQKFPDEVLPEQYLIISGALVFTQLLKQAVELSDLALLYHLSFNEKRQLLENKAQALSVLRKWDSARSAYQSIIQLIKGHETYITDPEQLFSSYLSAYSDWISLEKQARQCETASNLFEEMTTAHWYRQIGHEKISELQFFIDAIADSVSDACRVR